MCGIYGIVDTNGAPPNRALLASMADSLSHRGPDGEGVHCAATSAIGNRRLSIIDIEGGAQPMLSDDGRVAIVQNGEIYNFKELRAELLKAGVRVDTMSDTEVILRLYEREGPGFVSRLNGMFAIAILDERLGKLRLWRDRLGVKPLYVARTATGIVFGSEIKTLLIGGAPRRMDMETLHHFLSFNYAPPPRTFFEGVRHVQPGGMVEIALQGGAMTERLWWRLSDTGPAKARSEEDWSEEILALLEDATRIRLRADVPVGAFLSGGLDSSTVLAMAARHANYPIKTYCIGFQEARFDESAWAQRVADAFGAEHVCEIAGPDMAALWPLAVHCCDQPHGDVSFMPTYLVSRLAARERKVVLTGDGGDELFGGYEKYAAFFGEMDVSSLSEAAFRRAYFESISLLDADEKQALYTPETSAALKGLDTVALHGDPVFDQVADRDRINQALYFDTTMLLPGNNLVKPDRMAMAASLEARSPYLDYRMAELAFSMPGDLKLRGTRTKHILKQAAARLLDDDVINRPKQMFTVPVGEWFRKPLEPVLREALLSDRHADRGVFDIAAISRMIDAHVTGAVNHTRILRALVAVELWHRSFIDTPPTAVAPRWNALGLEAPTA